MKTQIICIYKIVHVLIEYVNVLLEPVCELSASLQSYSPHTADEQGS